VPLAAFLVILLKRQLSESDLNIEPSSWQKTRLRSCHVLPASRRSRSCIAL
jgi:hypothetical protein